MKKTLLLFVVITNWFIGLSQVIIEKTFGRDGSDHGYSFKCTSDGGFILVGESSGTIGTEIDADTYLIKTNEDGDTLWTKYLGSDHSEKGRDILEIESGQIGRYIILSSVSEGINLTQTDSIGSILWSKNYAGSTYWTYGSLDHNLENGYIILGRKFESGNWLPQVLTVNENGDVIWSKTFTNGDIFYSIKTVSDGYILAGSSSEFSINDMVFTKIDAFGNQVWRKTFGGEGYDVAFSLNTTLDGGFIFVGSSSKNSSAKDDICIVKTNHLGETQWTKTYGGELDDIGNSVHQLNSGGFVILGSGKNLPNEFSNMVLIQTDSIGNELFTRYFGNSTSNGNCLHIRSDSSYAMLGSILTSNNWDVYFVNFKSEFGLQNNNPSTDIFSTLYPNPTSNSAYLTWNITTKEKVNFTLYDQLGKTIRKSKFENEGEYIIERGNLSSGVYQFELSNSKLKINGKLIIL